MSQTATHNFDIYQSRNPKASPKLLDKKEGPIY